MRAAARRRAFTLLESMIALAILGVSLLAIFDINSMAVTSHVYAKKLTVATLLARSKMTDIEQDLYDKGFQSDDDEQAGDFSDEGWPSFKWRAKIIAPKTNGLSPDQLIGAIFNLPLGGEDSKDGAGAGGMGAIMAMFGGGKGGPMPPGALHPGADPKNGMMNALGPMAGLAQTQFTQLVDQLTKSVREVHLTVTWKDGKSNESIDIVTHVVSLGQGTSPDRNGGQQAVQSAQATASGQADPNAWVRAIDGTPVSNPVPGPNGGMTDGNGQIVIPKAQWLAQQAGAAGAQPGNMLPPTLPGLKPGLFQGGGAGLPRPGRGAFPGRFQ